jgi:hypothetical protein
MFHEDSTHNHVLQTWTFSSVEEMEASTGPYFSKDIGKVALVDESFYMLYSTTPTWKKMMTSATVSDATKIQGRNVSADAPSDGESYIWDSDTSEWVPGTVAVSAHEHVVDDITDFPSSMTPSAHTHTTADVTDIDAADPDDGDVMTWQTDHWVASAPAEHSHAYVPETRMVNGLPLSADIVISTTSIGVANHMIFCEDVQFAGTTPVWHELEPEHDGGSVGSHTATTTSYTELDRYVTDALGTTVIPAGMWDFILYAKVSAQTGQLKAEIYRVDLNGAIVGGVLGTAESVAFANTVTVGIPLSVYIAEKTVWALTDRIGVVLSGKKIGAPAATLTFYHDVASGWGSGVITPLTLLHDNLAGLNIGDYMHLTSAQHSGLTGGNQTSLHSHAGSGAIALDDITDVDLGTPQTGDLLTYATDHWEAAALSEHDHSSYISVATVGVAAYNADYTVDGVNDEVQIQAAVTDVAAAGGGVVYLYPGQYNIYAMITVPKDSKLRIEGAYVTKSGYGGTSLKVHSSVGTNLEAIIKEAGDAVADESNADHSHACHYSRLIFDGNTKTDVGLLLYNTDHTIVSDCKFVDMPICIDGQYSGTVSLSDYAGGLRLQSCSFMGSNINIRLNSHTQDWITDCWFLGVPVTHIQLISCNKIHFSNNEFNTVSGQIFIFDDTVTLFTGSIDVTGGFMSAGSGKNFWLDNRTNSSSGGVLFTGVRFALGTKTKLFNQAKDSQIATYTYANVVGGYVDPNYNDDVCLINATSGAIAVRLPLALTALKSITIKAINVANAVTVVPTSSDTIEQDGTLGSVYTFGEVNESVTFTPDADKWRVTGNHVPSLMTPPVSTTAQSVVEVSSATYAIGTDKDIILVNALSNSVALTLPTKSAKYAVATKALVVKVINATNTVTVTRAGTDEIDTTGTTQITISDLSAVTFVANSGSKWRTYRAHPTATDYSVSSHTHTAPSLDDLTGVTLGTPETGDVLTYATDHWEAAAPTGGGAPTDASYVVESASGGLSAESVLGTTVITRPTYAGLQAAAVAGRVAMPSDSYYMLRDDGAAWNHYGPIFPVTPPVSGDFSWVNQGSATLETTYGGMHLTAPAGSGDNIRSLVKSAPGSTPWTLTTLVVPMVQPVAYHTAGICVRESSTGKIIILTTGYGSAANVTMAVKMMTNSTTFSSFAYSLAGSPFMYPIWLRIVDSGTNLEYYRSADGRHFTKVYSHSRTAFMAGGANQIGIAADTNNTSLESGILLLSWAVT